MKFPDVYKMEYGVHKGVEITKVPVNYLNWMVGIGHEKVQEARKELDRRGSITPDLDISPHALNRFSERFLDRFIMRQNKAEGIHTFLYRMARKAATLAKRRGVSIVKYEGIRFVFEMDKCVWPVLKTVA